MSLRLIQRFLFVLAAFAIFSGAMASPMPGISAQAAGDCLAMKVNMPCPASKSGPCKMAASDCAKMMMCGGTMLAVAAQPAVLLFGHVSVSYGEAPGALRGCRAKPALFPPKTI